MVIRNLTRQIIISQKTIIAQTPFSRMKGLLGRKDFAPSEALVIRPCNSVHMLFMLFAIDVLFVNRSNEIVGLVQGLKPYQFSAIYFKAEYVIELPVSTIEITKTQIGDKLELSL